MSGQPTPSPGEILRIRVFLASPGDVSDERALALRVLERLPYDPFLRGRIAVETVAWDKPGADTPMLATMTPQEAISQQRPKPSECDIVVVIFWSRMGTPLPPECVKPDGGAYLSGTEWEYLDALEASQQEGRPKVLVYRRTEVPSIKLDDPRFGEKQDQWRLVKDFFASFCTPDGAIRRAVNSYDTPDAFEKKLTEHLREIVQALLSEREARSQPLVPETAPELATTAAGPSVPPLWEGSPFPGLRAFGEEDAPIYFGRGRETDGLIRRLGEGARFIVVVGASGSGKSSLVAAGLLPRLRDNAIPGSRDWVRVRFTPGELGENPFIALAAAFRPALERRNRQVGAEAQRLETDPNALAELTGLTLKDHPEWSELLLFVDQLEELFTVVADKHRTAFSGLIARATELSWLRTVATLRADFYHRCVEQPTLEEPLRAGSYPLGVPGVGAFYEMITRPAARAGLTFEDELPERILDDTAAEPGALPLMAFALEELYGQRSAGGKLTHAAYETFGGVKGAISRRAEETYGGLHPAAQATLAAVFRELVEVDLTNAGWVATRRRADFQKVAVTPQARELVSAFQGARLLQQSKGEHDLPVVEVAHEALLHNWPRLTHWIRKTGEDLVVLRQLRRAAEDWQAQDRRGDLRWPRRRWKQAERMIDRLQIGDLGEPAPSFLAASRRGTRRLTGALALVLAVLALLGWLALFTYTAGEGNFKYTVDVLWERALYALGASDIREPEMVWLRPGEDGFPRSFQMGSGDEDPRAPYDEKPRHEVAFSRPFAIGRYEVTFAQYAYFVRKAGEPKPSDDGRGRGQRPVVNISWEDATGYAHWLSLVTGKGYRLPTEAEWEYAARGGSKGRYWWCPADQPSCDIPPDMADCRECKSMKGLGGIGVLALPVGSFPANSFGLCDTAGNVWEWVQDCWHKTYTGDPPKDGSAWGKEGGGDCSRRILRGGSWGEKPVYLRSAERDGYYAVYRDLYIGFRLAQDP